MEATNNKKEIIVLRIYSILILIYSVFDIITGILPKYFAITIKPNTAFVNYFFTLTGIALYTTPINIIVGYGLLRRRFWARYAVMAVMLTFFVYVFSQYLYLWKFCFYQNSVYIQFLFVVLTLFFFTRKRAKALFGESYHFKSISWHALLVVIIILFSFYSIFFSIFMKIKYKLPFFVDKPQGIALKKPDLSEIQEKYQKVELLNASLLIPKDFGMRRLFKLNPGWNATFQNKGKKIKGMITLTNGLPYGDPNQLHYEDNAELRNKFGNISKFNLEKYFLTNNWNPAVMVIRSDRQRGKIGSVIDRKEIHINGNRGFLERRRQADDFFCGEFTLYGKEEHQFIGGYYLFVKKYFDDNIILPTLSSVEFLKPEGPDQAKNHYEKGLVLYKRGDILQAQVEFANAYMLSPQNPDFIFMLAKSLFSKEIEDEDYVRDLLNNVLKIRPGHKEAQRLMKELGPKLPKERKQLENR
jgi:tetratricopeptide (TPR) repeat protein